MNWSYAERLLRWLSAVVIDEYLTDCRDRGLRSKTIDWYKWHLTRARDWMIQDLGCHPLGLLDAEMIKAYYRSTAELAVSTRRYLVAALQAFGGWLEREHGMDNPAAGLRKPRKQKKLPEVLSPSEVNRLLQVIHEESVRDRAMVLLFLDAGLRVSELIHLTRKDLDVDAGQLTVRDGKGGKDRIVYFFERSATALREYLATHDHEYVFVSQRVGPPPGRKPLAPKPLTDNGVRQILRKIARRHGFKALNPHTLRRTCGTELAANGVDLSTIADQFGHEDMETTRIYTRLADERRREVLRKASPVDSNGRNGLQYRLPGLNAIPVPDWPHS